MLKTLTLALALSTAAALPVVSPAEAAVGMSAGEAGDVASPLPVQNVQFIPFFGGHQYCWYDDGWRGPGWYWCGYAFRQGLGWGGGYGWNNWGGGHRFRRGSGGGRFHSGGVNMGGARPGGGMHAGGAHMHRAGMHMGGMHMGGMHMGGGHGGGMHMGGGHGGGGHGGGGHRP